jgi:hypothetical protein
VGPSKYKPDGIVHTMSWLLDWKTYGGVWVYYVDHGLATLSASLRVWTSRTRGYSRTTSSRYELPPLPSSSPLY